MKKACNTDKDTEIRGFRDARDSTRLMHSCWFQAIKSLHYFMDNSCKYLSFVKSGYTCTKGKLSLISGINE
jgi:hypothetical protein